MKRFRVLACAVLLSFSAAAIFAADPSLPELFKRAKEKFAAGDNKESLSDFELLDTNSAKPGFEFITKEGYGTAVLQKESEPMQTLGIADDLARRDKKLN